MNEEVEGLGQRMSYSSLRLSKDSLDESRINAKKRKFMCSYSGTSLGRLCFFFLTKSVSLFVLVVANTLCPK